MKAKCKTCLFHNENSRLCNEVKVRVLNASQMCHQPRGSNRPETHLCRGARDFQLEIFSRLGVIKEPTDEAWLAQAHSLGIE